eukprot:521724-Pelagomonas_calceolata.AAC.1
MKEKQTHACQHLLHQRLVVSVQAVFTSSLQHGNQAFFCISDLMDLLLAGKHPSQADEQVP